MSEVDGEGRMTMASDGGGAHLVAKRLLRGGSWALLAKLSTFPVGFALAWLLARLLSPENLGGYFLVTSLVGLISALAQLGLGHAMVKLVAANLAAERPRAAREAVLVGGLATLIVAAIAAGLLAGSPGRWLIALLQGGEILQGALPWIALLVIGYAASEFLGEALRGFFDLRGASLLAELLLQRIMLMTLLAFVWAIAWQPTLEQVLMLAFFAALVSMAVGATLLHTHLSVLGRHGPNLRWRDLMSTGPAFLLARINFWLLIDAGVWFLGIHRPPEEVGIYGAASLLGMLVLTPAFVVGAVQAPMIAELYSQGRIRTLEKALRGTAALSAVPALVLTVALVALGESVLTVLFGLPYAQGSRVLAILAIGRFVSLVCGSGAMVLIMANHQWDVMVTVCASSLLAVAGYLLLGQDYGADGIALVAASAIALQGAMLAALARKRLGIATWPELSTGAFVTLWAHLTNRA